jgi:MATE family multidrug resistance protein
MFLALTTSVIRQPVFWSYQVFSGLANINLKSLLEVIRLGLPIGLTYGVESALFTVAALLMGVLGTTQLAAYQIAERTVYVVYMIPVGIYQAVSILVGQAFGMREIKKVRTFGRMGLFLGGVCECFAAFLFWLVPEPIVGLYIQDNIPKDLATSSLAKQFLMIAAIFLIFDGTQIIMSGAIQGLKDSKSTMIISLIGYWVIGLPVAYILGFRVGLGGDGIWWGLSAGLASGAILMTLYFELKTWFLLQKVEYKK